MILNILFTLFQIPQRYRFSSKSQQFDAPSHGFLSCFRYHKGTDFQANHNTYCSNCIWNSVVLDTTKVQIFKQITTLINTCSVLIKLFQIPQRYRFSSKSQPLIQLPISVVCCFRYHKGTDFQANHNHCHRQYIRLKLFQIPQRYRFSSKSQHKAWYDKYYPCCFRYHKGTDFQANHNGIGGLL